MRYRVHYVAHFERQIDAVDDGEAQLLALVQLYFLRLPEGASCHWDELKPVYGGDDD